MRSLRLLLATLVTAGLAPKGGAQEVAAPPLSVARLPGGIALHYEERGAGLPVVFVHGSLSDGGYWHGQLPAFAHAGFRAVAYSRRYNPPNENPARVGYSAVVDADDLASLITQLKLGPAHVVGHSYGALVALFLATRHPELVRSVVLAEAPAVSLLAHLGGARAKTGVRMYRDIQERMVSPMEKAFRSGDREAGLAAFLDYVFASPQAWTTMAPEDRKDALDHAHEWDVMMTTGVLFPEIDADAVRSIEAPALVLSGAKSYPFLTVIDDELARLLPRARHVVLPHASHRMWFEEPEACRETVLDFLRAPKPPAIEPGAPEDPKGPRLRPLSPPRHERRGAL